jgi:addiction module HigA family antidote
MAPTSSIITLPSPGGAGVRLGEGPGVRAAGYELMWITIESAGGGMAEHDLEPITPGEILVHEFMEPLGLDEAQLARELDLPAGRISDILRGRAGVTADVALRLERYFGASAQFWLNLQSRYDLKIARRDVGPAIQATVKSRRSA